MKNIVWILHLWFNQNFMKRYFFVCKEIKILYSTIRLICINIAAFWRISTGHKLRMLFLCQPHHKDMLFSFKSKRKERRRRIRVVRLIYAICVQWILSKWCYGDADETNCWIKLLFLFSLHTKKYSRHFIKGLDSVIYLAVNGTVTSLPVFIRNILNCVPNKMGVND